MAEPASLKRAQIRKHINWLRGHLPDPPTAVSGCFSVPGHMLQAVAASGFSAQALQAIADNMGSFLGLLGSAKVCVSRQGSGWHAPPAQAGSYTGGSRPEIHVVLQPHLTVDQALGVLAHECTHRYLEYRGALPPDKSEAEVMTDVAGAYLGLGGILLKGYEPAEWTTDYWRTAVAYGWTRHAHSIGYVAAALLRLAIAESAVQRRMVALAAPLGWPAQLWVGLLVWRARRRDRKSEERRRARALALLHKCAELERNYRQFGVRLLALSQRRPGCIRPDDACKLVQLAHKLQLGQLEPALAVALKQAQALAEAQRAAEEDLSRIEGRISSLAGTLHEWDALLSKYA